MKYLYVLFSYLIYPFLGAILQKRIKKNKEDPKRWREKLGFTDANKPQKSVIWFHAASVGEAKSIMHLVRHVHEKFEMQVLFTTSSLSAFKSISKDLPEGVVHQFLPIDSPIVVKRFLNFWNPKVVLFNEQELYYNIFRMSKKYGAKLMLINARFSPKSRRKWRFSHGFLRSMLSLIDSIYAYDKELIGYFKTLGIEAKLMTNIKYRATLDDLQLHNPPVADSELICVASTHKNEEEIILEAIKTLPYKIILAPRHPHRHDSVVNDIQNSGADFIDFDDNLSLDENIERFKNSSAKILLIAKLGFLHQTLSYSKLAILGGSFVEGIGGHNIIEPIGIGIPTITGPYNHNFENVVSSMLEDKAVIMSDESSLQSHVSSLMSDINAYNALLQAGNEHFQRCSVAQEYLPELESIIKSA